MQGIGDPDLFELSEVVDKSSKTGIFTNTRLLMIKDGYLYYYSKVPEDYKGHEHNVMSSLKEYPKCSIEIKHIKRIRPESPKSPTLIIEFHEKDLIDRQDIRKSLSSKNFNAPKKEGNDLEEWKFSFANFNKCKQWYMALDALKSHYQKQQDKEDRFTQYMANFDNELRKSLPKFSPNNSNAQFSSHLGNRVVANNQNGQPTASQLPNKPDSNQPTFNLPPPDPSRKNFPSIFGQPQYELPKGNSLEGAPENFNDKYKMDKSGIFAIQEEESQDQDLTVTSKMIDTKRQEEDKGLAEKEASIEKQLHQVGKSQTEEKIDKNKEEELQAAIKAIEESKLQQQKQSQQLFSKAVEQAKKQIKQEEMKKAEQQSLELRQSLEAKETIIRQMQEELEFSKKVQLELEDQVISESQKREQEERLRAMLERERKEEEEYRKLREYIGNEPSIERQGSRETHIKEESIQTEFQQDLVEVLEANSRSTDNKISMYSYHSDFNRTDTLLHQISSSRATQPKQSESLQYFDYFYELAQLYKDNDTNSKVAKEIALSQFVRKANDQASLIVSNYLDENKPSKSLKLQRHVFEIQIICNRGQYIRTQGKDRLLYDNEEHQRLKRTFKIYNQLQQTILLALKKKPNYPLRVPFCCLIEYKGYSALVQILPQKLTPSKNHNLLKSLGPNIPAYNLRIHDFQTKDCQCCLITVPTVYKSTRQDQTSLLKIPLKHYDFLEVNRRENISIESQKLFQESTIESAGQRRTLAKIISFCRELKKIMKARSPFAEYPEEMEFFEEFLKFPEQYIEDEDIKINGILMYYCQKLLGISLKSRIGVNEPNYSVSPVMRGFSLLNLDISLFASKIEKLCIQGKFQLAELALKYSKDLNGDYCQILLKEILLNICKQKYSESLYRIELAYQMVTPHDPRKLKLLELKAQCCEALGQYEDVLSTLKILLEETQYMYDNKEKMVEVYFLIAGTLSRQQLNKELVEVYRKIISEAPDHRNRVVLEFSQALLTQQADPHVLLDFLQEQNDLLGSAPQTELLLGDIYFRCKNYQKAITFYENAFESIINIQTNHPDLFSAYQRLIECLPSLTQKKSIHRQLVKFSHHTKLSQDLWKRFNTLVAEVQCQSFSREERERLMEVIEEKGRDSCSWIGSSEHSVLEWTEMEKALTGSKRGDEIALKKLMESADVQKLTDHCFLLNNSAIF